MYPSGAARGLILSQHESLRSGLVEIAEIAERVAAGAEIEELRVRARAFYDALAAHMRLSQRKRGARRRRTHGSAACTQ